MALLATPLLAPLGYGRDFLPLTRPRLEFKPWPPPARAHLTLVRLPDRVAAFRLLALLSTVYVEHVLHASVYKYRNQYYLLADPVQPLTEDQLALLVASTDTGTALVLAHPAATTLELFTLLGPVVPLPSSPVPPPRRLELL
jgi:hypothetical protein